MHTNSQQSCLILSVRFFLVFGLEIRSAIRVLSEGIVCLVLISKIQYYRYVKGTCLYNVLIWRIIIVNDYHITCEDYEGSESGHLV